MTTMVQTAFSATPTAPTAPRRSFVARIWAAYELGQSRKQLRELPDYLLADIGVTRGDAGREAGRPFWDQPEWSRV